MGGVLNAQQGLTLSAGKFITTGGGGGTPSATQIGGVVAGTITGTGATVSNTNWQTTGSVSVPPGVWILQGTSGFTSAETASRVLIGFGPTQKTNSGTDAGASDYGLGCLIPTTNSVNPVYAQLTAYYRNTTASAVTAYMNINIRYTGTQPVISSTNWQFSILKIA